MKKLTRCSLLSLLLITMASGPVLAQAPATELPPRAAPTVHVENSALPTIDATPAFDAARATAGYLSRVNGVARASSDAYFDGGLWLQLLDLLWALGIAGLLLFTGLSARLRDWAEERTRWRSGQVMLYGAGYVAAFTLLELPLTLYEGFFREHAYGLSNQDVLAWAGDFGIQFALTLVAAVIVLPLLTLLADIIGIAGGWLVGVRVLDMSPALYIQNTWDFLQNWDVESGLIKAAVFGFRADHEVDSTWRRKIWSGSSTIASHKVSTSNG